MPNLPILSSKDMGLSVACFEWNQQDGKKNYSFSIQRSHKKKDSEEYENETINCYADELLKLANLCQRAYNQYVKYRQDHKDTPATTPASASVQSSSSAPAQSLDDDIPF